MIQSSAALRPCIFPTPAWDNSFLFLSFFSFKNGFQLKKEKPLNTTGHNPGLSSHKAMGWQSKVFGLKILSGTRRMEIFQPKFILTLLWVGMMALLCLSRCYGISPAGDWRFNWGHSFCIFGAFGPGWAGKGAIYT